MRAEEDFEEKIGEKTVKRKAGDRWMVYGPCKYIFAVESTYLELRERIPLDKNEGIYVRDTRDGSVRSVQGKSYMLESYEELWEMPLDETVEQLLPKRTQGKYRQVVFRCPFNAAVQIYDYKRKTSRACFGPDLISLEPDEQFTVFYLSGGKPKKPGQIKTIEIGLGPDFFSDIFQVETSDHARLELQLSYNWFFKIDEENPSKIFNVRDFVGDACGAIASKVRGQVAGIKFEEFHKLSARHIRKAIFGLNEDGKIGDELLFKNNGLCVTNVDIQRVEPVDIRTKQSLQKSVTLAIEITTRMQEAEAKMHADQI